MISQKWNDCERGNYRRLLATVQGLGSAAEGLAYTAVMEMYNSRIASERHDEEKRRLRNAIDMMAEGIHELELILGISISKMAAKNFSKRMDAARKEGGVE